MNDWGDFWDELPNPYQVKKSPWPAKMELFDGQFEPVRKDWIGEGFFYIMDTRNGFMPPIVNLWAWEVRLQHTANTAKGYLTDIAVMLESIDNEGRPRFDLERRFATLDPMTKEESRVVINCLAYKKVKGELTKASLATYLRRLTSVSLFLRFGFDRYLEKMTDAKKLAGKTSRIERMIRQFVKAMPSSSDIEETTKSPKALSNEQLAVLRLAIAPQAKHNPFANTHNHALRYRNIAIINLLIEGGMRPSELCMLEKRDLVLENNQLWVSKWTVDSLEAHHNEMANYRLRRKYPRLKTTVGHKTKGRVLTLSPLMCEILQEYIDEHRKDLLMGKRRSPYLFLSGKDGLPLTPGGIRSSLLTVAKAFPAIGSLTSYTFRHTSVNVSAAALRKALSHVDALHRDQKIQEILTTKYGWSSTSEMPDHYGRDDLNTLLLELSKASLQQELTYSDEPIIKKKQRPAANDESISKD